MPEIVAVTPKIIADFLPAMGDAERADLERIGGAAVLRNAVALSVHSFAGVVDGVPAFVGGVVQADDAVTGRVWMMATPAVDRAKKFYLRETRRQVGLMLDMFDRLETKVAVDYPRSLRWLAWLGFKIGEAVEMNGRLVRPVELAR